MAAVAANSMVVSNWDNPINNAPPNIGDFIPFSNSIPCIEAFKNKAREKSLELLQILVEYQRTDITHKICTSESLTAGLIMSTLVDIPRFGVFKYGCFGVYDTDAKRVFNHVIIDDVYTKECASQMAIGTLQNSNASIAIAVTGNAMPYKDDWKQLGQVFFSVAKYGEFRDDYRINCNTWELNICNEIYNRRSNQLFNYANDICNNWVKICESNQFPPGPLTAAVSQIIRYYTVYFALDYCLQYIRDGDAVYPNFLNDRTRTNNETITQGNGRKIHSNIPHNKYNNVAFHNIIINRTNSKESSLHYMSKITHNNMLRSIMSPSAAHGGPINLGSLLPSNAPAAPVSAPFFAPAPNMNLENSQDSQDSRSSTASPRPAGGAAGKQRRKHIHRTYKRKHKK
jgi:nicotinamide mononucleotide (NMN) deamidase PncC